MMTDGVIISLRFIDIETFNKKNIEDIKNINKQKAKNVLLRLKQIMTPEQYEKHIEINKFFKDEDEKKYKLEKQKNKKKYIEAIKKNPSLIEKDFKCLIIKKTNF